MKRINYTILTVFILVISLSINTINCSASEPYFDDLVDAELATQEAMDMYNYYLSSDIVKSYLDEVNGYKYIIARCDVFSMYSYLYFYCFDEKVVMYENYYSGGHVLGILAKSDDDKLPCKVISFRTNSSALNPDDTLKVNFNQSLNSMFNNKRTINGNIYVGSSNSSPLCSFGNLVRCDVPVYQNADDAAMALEGNDIKPLYGNTITYSQDNAEKLYFKSFNVIPHVGTNLNTSYFVFNYELSDYAKNNIDNLSLYLSHQYFYNLQMPVSDFFSYRSNYYGKSIDLSNAKGTFTLYCSNLQGLIDFKNKFQFTDDAIVGRVLTIDVAEYMVDLIAGASLGDILYVDSSTIKFTCQIRGYENGKYTSGQWKSFTYDFLTHQSNTAGVVPDKDNWLSNENPSYTVDVNGEQTHNSYFYESAEDDEIKYYYTDGDKTTEITYNQYTNNEVPTGMFNPWIVDASAEGGNASATGGSAVANATVGDINININNGSGEYIDISPQDYEMYIDAIKSLLIELDTQGGLFLLLKDTYSLFPPAIWLLIAGGLGAAIWVSIVCIARGR